MSTGEKQPKDRVVYIAGPMTGLPDYNYPAFEKAERDLTARGYLRQNIINPKDHAPAPKKQLSEQEARDLWLYCMRLSIRCYVSHPLPHRCAYRGERGPCCFVGSAPYVPRGIDIPWRAQMFFALRCH